MLKRWFGRHRDVDVDQLIFDIAEHSKPADLAKFEQIIENRRFFLHVDPTSIAGLPRGVPVSASASTVKISGLAQIKGMTFLPLYTSAADKRLQDSYVEIEGCETLRMALRCQGIEGLMFQNKENSWVALRMEQIKSILARQQMPRS